MTHVHLIGIGGTGLSAIARVLLESGYQVTGSDQQLSPLAQALREAGVTVYIGHQPKNVAAADLVVRSSAVPDSNVEVQAAQAAGIPVLKRADFLMNVMEGYRVIAVAGSHGKTTTTAMLAWILSELGQDPGFIVGGVVSNLGTNARAGKGSYFVIEADEYDHMFLGLKPDIAVITNVEHDHPDLFPTPEDFESAFRHFVGCLTPGGILLACGDDPGARRMLPVARMNGNPAMSYAIRDAQSNYLAHLLQPSTPGGSAFDAFHAGEYLANVTLQVPGEHNVLNALATLAVVDLLDLSIEDAAQALVKFRGSGRRFEVVGETGGVTIIDDYAHHPTEIRATLEAARARYPGSRLWVVWQPHTYSRTKALFDQFAASFEKADRVVVTEVYRAREPYQPDFSAGQVVQAMRHKDAHFIPELAEVVIFLLARLQPGDVLLVLSAGDANQICTQVLAGLIHTGSLKGKQDD
jgi:UDP-N-acetylmuramate--alanine ligase